MSSNLPVINLMGPTASGKTALACELYERGHFEIISVDSDWLYPVEQGTEILTALNANDVEVSFSELKSNYGHDAFLLEPSLPDLIHPVVGSLVLELFTFKALMITRTPE